MLESASGGNHASGLDHAIRGLDLETGPADQPLHFPDLYAAPDRRSDHVRVSDKIICNLFLGDKGIWAGIRKLHARETVMPGRAIGNQRVPSFGAPAFGDTPPLEDEMRHPALAQMFAHGQPRLAAAYNERVYLFD